MFFTEEHDKLLCREILAVDPFTGTKKGTVQRGTKWTEIADHLNAIASPKFKVNQKSVRDRYNLLAKRLKTKLEEEKKASGIETDMTETETALEELLVKEEMAEAEDSLTSQTKARAKEAEKVSAEDMRRKAMEKLSETKKRKQDEEMESGTKKKRSNGNDTILFLREKNEMMEKMKRDEMELKRKEVELQTKRHDDLMKIMVEQQQQQAKATQDFQSMMMTLMSKLCKNSN